MMRRLFGFPRRSARTIRADVDDELRFHMDSRAEELVAGGLEAEAARRQAEREFGDLDDARRYLRDVDRQTEAASRRRDLLGELRQDVVYALRQLRAAPAFAVTAIATLAFGIAACTAIFSVVRGVLLRPLPYPQPGQLVRVWSANRAAGQLQAGVSVNDVDDWRAQKRVVADVAGYFYQPDGGSGVDLTGGAEPQRLAAVFVTGGFFPTLGLPADAGRLPRDDEMVRGGDDHVVVLSHAFWAREFGSRRGVLDSTITLGGEPYRVLGVLPAAFQYPADQVDVYLPYSSIPDDAIPHLRAVRVLSAVARVGAGHTIAEAQAELDLIAGRLAQQYPENASYGGVTLVSLQDAMTGGVRQALLILFAAVLCLLAIACANVAGLQLARGSARAPELAVRAALGAGRRRIVRQLLTESLVLSLIGGAAGLLLARLGVQLLLALAAGQLPRAGDVALDPPVLVFALVLSLASGVVFGLVPSLRNSAGGLQGVLREGGRGVMTAGRRLRGGLVVAEVALAVVLVVGAGLMIRSFVALTRVDAGFRPDHLLAVNFTISTARHPDDYTRVYHDIIDRVRDIPGVQSAGAAKNVPFRGSGESVGFTTAGMVLRPGEDPPTAVGYHISDGYFRTIGTPLLAGREFTPQDTRESPPVVVINRALATRYFPGASAVGQRLLFGANRSAEIVGVVGDIRQSGMDEPAAPSFYIDNMQNSRVKTTIVARTAGDPLAMAAAVRAAIWSVDKDQTITSIFTFEDVVGEALARPRLLTVLLGVFALTALLLGALGIYGLLAYQVSQRRREIGVRLALGADRGGVARMIVGRGIVLAGIGVAIGLGGALALTRLLRGVLYGVGTDDPGTFAAVALVLVAVAALASWLPARRAAAVDPAVALRDS